MRRTLDLDRFRVALLGLAVGDAVGTTVEFKPPGTFAKVTDMVGGGPFGLPVGAWTDDTSMALCLAESLVERAGFDPVDQLRRYVRWYSEGHLSSMGRCFDIGEPPAIQGAGYIVEALEAALWAQFRRVPRKYRESPPHPRLLALAAARRYGDTDPNAQEYRTQSAIREYRTQSAIRPSHPRVGEQVHGRALLCPRKRKVAHMAELLGNIARILAAVVVVLKTADDLIAALLRLRSNFA